MVKEKLIVKIESAFSDVSYPGDDRIIDFGPWGLEGETTKKLFTAKDWRDPSIFAQGVDTDSLDCFSPEAFKFFLPAFMIQELREGGYFLNIYIVPWFDPKNQKDRKRLEERLSLLSYDQRKTIAEFIKCLYDIGEDEYPLKEEVDRAIATLLKEENFN